MLVRQLQLALRRHHAVALNAADIADLDGDIETRNIRARFTQNDGDPFARVRRAADDLFDAFVGLDLADFQLVRIRMFLGRIDLCDGKFRQALGRVRNPFHLKTKVGQGVEDLVKRSVCVQVVFQPGKREFHRSIPSVIVGSKGL